MHSSFKLIPIVFAVLAAIFVYQYSIIFSNSKFDFVPKLQHPIATPAEPSTSIFTADMSVSRQVIKKVFAVETSEVISYLASEEC